MMTILDTIAELDSNDFASSDFEVIRKIIDIIGEMDTACQNYFDGSGDNDVWKGILSDADLDTFVDGDEELECLLAYCREFNCHPSDCTISTGGAYGYGYAIHNGREEWSVMTDDDADSAWDDSMESYLDEGCVEGADSPYFDREAWKRDASYDGRGHFLSGYDGNEYDHRINGTTYIMFRTN
jgi:hypothetical protein